MLKIKNKKQKKFGIKDAPFRSHFAPLNGCSSKWGGVSNVFGLMEASSCLEWERRVETDENEYAFFAFWLYTFPFCHLWTTKKSSNINIFIFCIFEWNHNMKGGRYCIWGDIVPIMLISIKILFIVIYNVNIVRKYPAILMIEADWRNFDDNWQDIEKIDKLQVV